MNAGTRLSVFYGLVFGLVAVQMAYWPLWLKQAGFGEAALGLLLSLGFALKVFVNPVFRRLAVRFTTTRTALVVSIGAAFATFTAFGAVSTLPALALVQILFFTFWVPVLPTTEYLALDQVRRGTIDYGRVRLWGSIGFLVASLCAGSMLQSREIGLVYWIVMVVLATILLAASRLPPGPPPGGLARTFSLSRLMAVPGFTIVLAAAGCVQGSHAMLYGFGSIHWKSIGLGETAIGALWAEGILIEIGVFLAAPRLQRRIGAAGLLVLGGVGATLRWALMPAAAHVWQIGALQLLHGASFALTHLGAMRFISHRVSEDLVANALALYSMVVMGLFMGASVLASGWLYHHFGGGAFGMMAAFSAIGVSLALAASRRHTRVVDQVGSKQ